MGIYDFSRDGQDVKLVQKVLGKLRSLLGAEERILYIAVQRKSGLNLLQDVIVASDLHLFLCEPTKLGFDMHVEALTWDAILKIEFVHKSQESEIKIIPNSAVNFILENIPNVQARALERIYLELEERTNSEAFIHIESDNSTEKEAIVLEIEVPQKSPMVNPLYIKLVSLYHRQLISKSEFETCIKMTSNEKSEHEN